MKADIKITAKGPAYWIEAFVDHLKDTFAMAGEYVSIECVIDYTPDSVVIEAPSYAESQPPP